ncbi:MULTISPECIES: NAD(P)H-dependent glycerol-3-phosphate dehydrogenase [Bacillus]|uniref:Glycerol-3-phosphate dehydrogenase [NAD(P)+] n=2 Tax=Bacillales TaxID=1385 RepID=A0AAP4DGL9_BACAM|nr:MULTISPECIES: NAD(P)H-dependent glycerol-3-phosphate dehydrogenase [Bacillus]ATU27206.1 glycerol-3-phosphate dehydrogenase [Bacillus velezensis]AUS15637.1 NAD(P)H-dependent glycerol-3-phosphate dehydrogenase [Bacillus velezensis]AWM44595.1 NAD(P)H-dependent glycerol-3-phosphate dehydrogenase [Bacillus amyloliquefaciens]KAF1278432.1 glycerol-3-phosphate dehydrogenase [Bacillus amyloliquefaciens]KAF6536712.1 NAD(P)H-dependent glycerol-3-phosphate dehydrogenase [Bacillus sp. EKM208B]
MKKVAMLGAGSWGTALSLVLADNGHQVMMWGHRAELIDQINDLHENKDYLPGVELSSSIIGTADLNEALKGADFIIVAVPTKAIREVLKKALPYIPKQSIFVHVSKGIEPDSLLRISELMEEELPEEYRKDIVVLSGPSHAEEVGLRHPTTVTSSSKNIKAAEAVQDLFMNQHFRVYTNPDMIGVEIGGALKNIIALAAGITDGLGYGDNAKAALITRGLAEIARLGTKMGGNPLTFSGLTGVGDLIVTCTSVHSRNWRAGNLLGKGYKLEAVLDKMGMVVEGVRTTKAAYQLSQKYQVKMPITEALHQVLFNGQKVETAVESLMARVKTHEMEDLVNTFENRVK